MSASSDGSVLSDRARSHGIDSDSPQTESRRQRRQRQRQRKREQKREQKKQTGPRNSNAINNDVPDDFRNPQEGVTPPRGGHQHGHDVADSSPSIERIEGIDGPMIAGINSEGSHLADRRRRSRRASVAENSSDDNSSGEDGVTSVGVTSALGVAHAANRPGQGFGRSSISEIPDNTTGNTSGNTPGNTGGGNIDAPGDGYSSINTPGSNAGNTAAASNRTIPPNGNSRRNSSNTVAAHTDEPPSFDGSPEFEATGRISIIGQPHASNRPGFGFGRRSITNAPGDVASDAAGSNALGSNLKTLINDMGLKFMFR
jgi:hypothetical protein